MKDLTFSELKSIYSFCEENGIDPREVVKNIAAETDDFEVNDYRFISESDIDRIQVEELESDPYILGCFTDWFISDNCSIDLDVVQALQKGELYEALGKIMLGHGISDLQEEYVRLDGYGNHFSNYDGNTLEDLLGLGYYCFRTN